MAAGPKPYNQSHFLNRLDDDVEGENAFSGNTLYVDAVNGNDATGARGTMLPFLTLAAAKTAALSGDTIIVGPGTYDERNLLKDGVHWYFLPNATINYTGSFNGGIFDDGDTGANAPIVCKILGYGVFKYSSATTGLSLPCVFNITQSGTHIDIVCQSIQQLSTATPTTRPAGIRQTAGYFQLLAHNIKAAIASAGITGSNGGGIVWGGGKHDVVLDHIEVTAGRSYALWGDQTIAGSRGWIRLGHIETPFSPISLEATDLTAEWHIDCPSIQCGADSSQGILLTGGKLFLRATKIFTASSVAILWLNGGECHASILQIDLGAASFGKAIEVISGSHRLDCKEIVCSGSGSNRRGVYHTGGSLRLIDCRVDIQTGFGSPYPIEITAAGLVLQNCLLVAKADKDSISSATAQTVISYGSYANKAVDADVTIDGLLTIGSYVQ